MAKEKTDGNGAAEKPAFVLAPARRQFYEQSHNQHRALVPTGTTTLDIENPEFLSACGDRVSGGDLVHVFDDDWACYWQAIAVGAGIETGVLERSSVRLIVFPNFPVKLPVVRTNSTGDLPAGYRVVFDLATRRHIPIWESPQGDVLLNADGMNLREEARRAVVHHAKAAASVARR